MYLCAAMSKQHTIHMQRLADLPRAAREFLAALGPDERIIAFHAPMGAGKTTFTTALCQALGVREDAVSSPTFAIVNEYWTRDGEPLYHFDFYRIDTPDDATRIGFQDYLYSGSYCFIEWTDKVESLLNGEYTPVHIERIDDQTRRFTF